MNDHIPDPTKMISDTPRMHSALMDAPDAGFANIWRVGCDIERELNTANDRIKRLEEESESRWHLAQSAIGSCAEMSSRIQRLEKAGDVMASILNNTRKDWYTSDQCEVSRLIGTKLRRPSCECRATNTDSIGVSRLQPSTRTPRNRSRSPEAGGSDQATGGPHQTRIHSVL